MKKLLLISALLIFACKNKIDESTAVLELTNKQSPTQFFSYTPEAVLIMKHQLFCWGPNELKHYGTMEQRLVEDLNVNGLNPKGYIFYRKQKGEVGDKTILIKYGPLIISDSIYNNNFHNLEFRIEATEVNREGNYSLPTYTEDKVWSLRGSNDSVINIPLKIKFSSKP
tara:strand:- start:37 stop:543 length:507 start_codon:yes stop_codon:yes gene_type:complete